MDIIGFGALNFDRLYKVEKLNTGDDEEFIQEEHEAPGGSGANTIYALARLGLKTGFIGAVGGDTEGDLILNDFKDAGVNTDGITVKTGMQTSLIIGFVDSSGERALYVSPRANSAIEWSDIDMAYIQKAKMLLFSSFVEDTQLELMNKIVEELPDSTQLILTPGALYSKKGYGKIEKLLARTNILFINSEEIKMLLEEDYKSGAEKFIQSGIGTIAVTLGAQGCYIRTSEQEVSMPASEVEAIDTTGAGDAFAAGFIWAHVKGLDLESCGKAGNLVASKCIQAMGARAGIPTEDVLIVEFK